MLYYCIELPSPCNLDFLSHLSLILFIYSYKIKVHCSLTQTLLLPRLIRRSRTEQIQYAEKNILSQTHYHRSQNFNLGPPLKLSICSLPFCFFFFSSVSDTACLGLWFRLIKILNIFFFSLGLLVGALEACGVLFFVSQTKAHIEFFLDLRGVILGMGLCWGTCHWYRTEHVPL